ncbi:putative calmodulin [Endogone sp. FLAS-F59071]|nr:putative calmodulin [Endogone sp. FLAS-F59071]|eukprot:RUS12987.1 putative calmodulin [Endogone sp. FLAS-F59071]
MANNLPPEVLEDLKAAFALYDKDGDGVVTTVEFALTLKGFGVDIRGTAFEDLIQRADNDHNGSIDFGEFVNMMTMNRHTHVEEEPLDPEEERLIQAFKEYDENGDGYISVEEFHKALTRAGQKVTLKDVEKLVSKVDQDGDGVISFMEFALFAKK